jgi:FG-GAP-like repeat
MATNNADSPPYANIIDASTKTIVAQIPWVNNTNGAEQCVYNPRTGLFYSTAVELNGPGDNSQPGGISVVDPKIAIAQNFTGNGGIPGPLPNPQANRIPVVGINVIPLSACDGPQGMAMGPQPGMLVGCNGGPASAQSNDASIVINDGSTGGVPISVIAELPNQDGPDMVDYNPSSRLYTLAKSTKTLTNLVGNIGMVSAVTFAPDTNISTVATSGGAHSVASDSGSRSTYVPIPKASAASKLCSSVGGVDANGCILQMTRSITNTHDFDANTASDVLLRDTGGNVGMWEMKLGTGAIQQSNVIGNVPLLWSVVGQRDFAGDGRSGILWRDTSGNLAMWKMNGPAIQGVTTYNPVPSTFQVAGTGEFNADGMGDILFEDPVGNLSISFMNGSAITSTEFLAKLPSGWVIAGTDRRAAIFLRNTVTGDVGVWVLKGATIAQQVDLGPVPLNWTIAGIGDFDGNGSSDILWQDTTGDVAIWLMETNPNTVKILSSKVLGTIPTQWSVAQTGDYSGNGKADILFIDNTGNVAAWFMNGNSISSVLNYGNIGTSWAIQSLNSE